MEKARSRRPQARKGRLATRGEASALCPLAFPGPLPTASGDHSIPLLASDMAVHSLAGARCTASACKWERSLFFATVSWVPRSKPLVVLREDAPLTPKVLPPSPTREPRTGAASGRQLRDTHGAPWAQSEG